MVSTGPLGGDDARRTPADCIETAENAEEGQMRNRRIDKKKVSRLLVEFTNDIDDWLTDNRERQYRNTPAKRADALRSTGIRDYTPAVPASEKAALHAQKKIAMLSVRLADMGL
jgi:hypothetical protein